MFGLLKQLDDWFCKAARNELDDPEGPLHPPVAYPVAGTSICVNADTPTRESWPWFGAAILSRRKPDLLEINAWEEVYLTEPSQAFAPTVLLNFELPFEYPRTVRYLLSYIENRGIKTSQTLVHLMLAAERIADTEPMYVVVGAPSRGITGDLAQRRQHLAVWEIESRDVAKLRAVSRACKISQCYSGQETPPEIQNLLNNVFSSLVQWQVDSLVRWCSVIENRPEVVTRRDDGTPMDLFKGKRVMLWGCGALGGMVAEHLVRAGVNSLALYDSDRVTPGILVRQNFVDADINDYKTVALKRRLNAIAPKVDVTSQPEDIITKTLNQPDWDKDVDMVLDATASLQIRSKLEHVLKGRDLAAPIAAMMVSGEAKHAAAVVCPIKYSGGPHDVIRRLGLFALNRKWLEPWVRAFWSIEVDEPTRQPEPGCSDPTFVASHADVATLASRMLNYIATELESQTDHAIGYLLAKQSTDKPDHSFKYGPDIVVNAQGIEFRIAANAWRDMRGWIRTGTRERSQAEETGGLLFGQYDEVLGIAWISRVSGPPKDSFFSSERFICGIEGTQQLCADYKKRTNDIIQYVGTWHSHPVSSAIPSDTDYAGIATIFTSNPIQGQHQLMIIVGQASNSETEIGAYVFDRNMLRSHLDGVSVSLKPYGNRVKAPAVRPIGKSIGLALSGGGSRAVAFHLGTLRALEDLQLLDEIKIISGVSGGALMTGLIGYTDEPFDKVDAKTVAFLKRGLVRPALIKLINPRRAFQVLAAFTLVPLLTVLLKVISSVASIIPGGAKIITALNHWDLPIPRWYSRTHVFADAIGALVGERSCNAKTRQNKNVVFNACELRTGTAFRMSNERFGSWRLGSAPACELRLADAIAASAAYPPILPPLDWRLSFERKGETQAHRIVVTDGGVFENLGVSVMEPGRDPKKSVIIYKPDIIIASDAGIGQFEGTELPLSWRRRMIQVFSAVMRKVQDATKQRLHKYIEAGDIDRFVYVHLGQIDERVFLKPANWIDRDSAVHYPTDFSAMPDEMIAVLSARGESITRALITEYLLSD